MYELKEYTFKVGDKVKFKGKRDKNDYIPQYNLNCGTHKRNNWTTLFKNEGTILDIVVTEIETRCIVNYFSKENEDGALNFNAKDLELLNPKEEIINDYSIF